MSTTSDNAFSLHLVRVLMDYDEQVHRDVVAWIESEGENATFSALMWHHIRDSVSNALSKRLEQNPEAAAAMLGAMFQALKPETYTLFIHLFNRLYEHGHFLQICKIAHLNQDVLYAVATYSCGFTPGNSMTRSIEEAVTALCQQPFTFSTTVDELNVDVAARLFGDAWVALYNPTSLSMAGRIEHVFIARPPIIGNTQSSVPVGDLPSSLTAY